MTDVTNVRMRPLELLRALPQVHRAAANEGVTPATYLELEDPSTEWQGLPEDKRGQDATGRLFEAAGIITRNRPAIGQRSTVVGDLLHGTHEMPDGSKIGVDAGRAALMIFAERRLRSVKYGASPNTRAMFMSDDETVGTVARPWDEGAMRRQPDEPNILPLSRLIGEETEITGTSYRAAYVDNIRPADETTYVRITEAAEFPTVKLRTRQQDLRLHKYGIAIDWSYEAEREMTMNRFGLTLEKIELSQELAKQEHVVDVIQNGLPGDPSSASVVKNLSDFDPAQAGVLDVTAWNRIRRSLPREYAADLIIGNDATIAKVEAMPVTIGNSMPFGALNAGQGVGTVENVTGSLFGGNQAIGVVDSLADDILLVLSTRFLIERVSQIGATVNESTEFITNQTRIMTFSEMENYTKMWDDASVAINLGA